MLWMSMMVVVLLTWVWREWWSTAPLSSCSTNSSPGETSSLWLLMPRLSKSHKASWSSRHQVIWNVWNMMTPRIGSGLLAKSFLSILLFHTTVQHTTTADSKRNWHCNGTFETLDSGQPPAQWSKDGSLGGDRSGTSHSSICTDPKPWLMRDPKNLSDVLLKKAGG